MTEPIILAYLAGVLDADGYLTVRRSTYHMRVRGDAGAPVYSEQVGMKQVTPEAITLLCDTFGGYQRTERPSAKNGRMLHAWTVTDKQAAQVARELVPYLRIKRRQAELLLELRSSKDRPRTGVRLTEHLNRWGQVQTFRQAVVSDDVLAERERIFNAVRALNDTRTRQPVLIGRYHDGRQ